MRLALLLLFLFAVVFTAWLEVGRRVVVDATTAYHAWSDSVFLRPGRLSSSDSGSATTLFNFMGLDSGAEE
jgi:hypothetical protein